MTETKRVPIDWFVEKLKERCKAKDGYIMGAIGQNPQKWKATSYYFNQYTKSPYTAKQHNKALYWREHAERVWDCNGLSEGIYMDYTGVNINKKARNNFDEWCSPKGWGRIPDQYQKPGTAVFKASKKGTVSSIHHVGYVSRVVGDTVYIIEAKGVMYGVVETVYNKDSAWNAWGLMTKYFDYNKPKNELNTEVANVDVVVERKNVLNYGANGNDVKELQEDLVSLGYELPKFGVDGDYGKETEEAVKEFQSEHGINATGIADTETLAAIDKAIDEIQNSAAKTQYLKVTGSRVNVRDAAGLDGKILGTVKAGSIMNYANEAVEGWYKTVYKNTYAWISAKYTVLD